MKAPPLQKLPVDGNIPYYFSGSKVPFVNISDNITYVAPTLWAPVGKYLPNITKIVALQPDKAGGITK